MEDLIMLENVCNEFIERKYDLEEFQSRLKTLIVEDSLKNKLGKILTDADNKLEEIRFSSLESNFYPYGAEVAKFLLERIRDFD